MRRTASMPSTTWLKGPGYRRTKILPASGIASGGKVTACSTEPSRRPLKATVCSRPFGTTSISRITNIRAPDLAFHFGLERQLEFSDPLGSNGELRTSHAVILDHEALFGFVTGKRKPVIWGELEA